MTEDRLPLAELMQKARDDDFLRNVAEAVVQLLMEADVEGLIGAGRHERSGERTTHRNGYRGRCDEPWPNLCSALMKLTCRPSAATPYQGYS